MVDSLETVTLSWENINLYTRKGSKQILRNGKDIIYISNVHLLYHFFYKYVCFTIYDAHRINTYLLNYFTRNELPAIAPLDIKT
jgi:hypothetical protein